MPLEKALLIRLDEGQEIPDAQTIAGYRANNEGGDGANWLRVHFNPETLKTSLSTALQSGSAGSGKATGQYIDKSDSSLTLDLVFDTSTVDAGGASPEGGSASPAREHDVRNITRKLAVFFLQTADAPGDDVSDRVRKKQLAKLNRLEKKGKLRPPSRCHFRWGSFGFTGMVATMSETLDYFSADGVPLRATVSLNLKQDRFQFEVFRIAALQKKAAEKLKAATAVAGTNGAPGGPLSVLADLNDPRQGAGQRPSARPPRLSDLLA